MLIGYARVSKADGSQSLDLQHDALRAAGLPIRDLAVEAPDLEDVFVQLTSRPAR